ncbi:MAG TPA: short-chain dehydrogenase, partial [Cytophagales bacterium]|nr:short-chain dehydrogenase [Cytophagales bacterium]
SDKKELKPFLISVIKTASRIMPNTLLNFGHGEFKKVKAVKNAKR